MKKLIILTFYLLVLTSKLFAFELTCFDKTFPEVRESLGGKTVFFDVVKVTLDNTGSVHYSQWNDSFSVKAFQDYLKKNKLGRKNNEDATTHFNRTNSLKNNLNDKYKVEDYFTEISHKAGNKFKTSFKPDEDNTTNLVFGSFLSIDVDSKTVKVYKTVSNESKRWWNSNWDEEQAQKDGVKKIGAPLLSLNMINCKTNQKASGYLDYWWAVILIIAITFFIFTQSGKRLKKIRRK
tara:strand:- start:715 stop:1422 length:708 start_codon:yes stop_codon:yes gene_type:complete